MSPLRTRLCGLVFLAIACSPEGGPPQTAGEAIVAATRINADILGLDQLGMVAAGKSASFVVLDANPLEDIKNTHLISRVYLRGEEVDREALRAKFMGS